jgi:hypothetical protein
MDSSLFKLAVIAGMLAGCAGRASVKPAEVLDERTGITVGALQDPLEFVANPQNALSNAKRASFAYLGPIEWDQMGDITYAVWVHVAPGNDRQVGDIRARGAVTLDLDDGPMVLSAIETPGVGRGPYRPVVSWGQTAYFALTVDMLKRMAGSQKLILDLRAVDDSRLNFIPSQDTHGTLTRFTRARGITDD